MNRLRCCVPTKYDAHSRTIIHGYLCHKAGQPLNDAEFAEWVASRPKHPAGMSRIEKAVRANNPVRTFEMHEHDLDGTPLCIDCQYVLHHMDDNDDRTLERVVFSPRQNAGG